MRRLYVLLGGMALVFLARALNILLLGLSLVVLAGYFIAHFSMKGEENVNMIVVALTLCIMNLVEFVVKGPAGTLLGGLSPFWLICLCLGSFFITLILMTLGLFAKIKPKAS